MPISSQDYQKQIVAIKENTYGVPPKDSNLWFHTGATEINLNRAMEDQEIALFGKQAIHADVVTAKTDTISMTTYIYNLDMLRRLMYYTGVGSAMESLTFLEHYKAPDGATDLYNVITGGFPEGGSLNIGTLYTLNLNYRVKSIDYELTQAEVDALLTTTTGPVFPPAITDVPKTNLDVGVGVDPFTVDAGAIDIDSLTINVGWQILEKKPLGSFDPKNLKAVNPRYSFNFSTWEEGPAQGIWDMLAGRANHTLAFKLYEVGTTDAIITLNNAKMLSGSQGKTAEGGDFHKENYGGKCVDISLTTPAV